MKYKIIVNGRTEEWDAGWYDGDFIITRERPWQQVCLPRQLAREIFRDQKDMAAEPLRARVRGAR